MVITHPPSPGAEDSRGVPLWSQEMRQGTHTMERCTTQRKATTHLPSLGKWRHTINYTRTQRNKRLQWPEQQKFASKATCLRLAIFRFMCDKEAEIP